jgi:hypothetical protein
MFKRKTLFVLGAGASAEVNLPVGAQLSKIIGRMLDIRYENRIPIGSGDFELYEQFKMAFPRRIASTRMQHGSFATASAVQCYACEGK